MDKKISEVLKEKYKNVEINQNEATEIKDIIRNIMIQNKKEPAINC